MHVSCVHLYLYVMFYQKLLYSCFSIAFLLVIASSVIFVRSRLFLPHKVTRTSIWAGWKLLAGVKQRANHVSMFTMLRTCNMADPI